MGQVPVKNLNGSNDGPNPFSQTPTVLIIGSGKLAKHLNHYFQLLSHKPLLWNRSQPQSLLLELLPSVSIVALAISDDALASFITTHLGAYDGKIVHFSGAKQIDKAICCHPLFTFSHQLYDLTTYQKIPFAITGTKSLSEIFEFLENPFFAVSEEQKGLYHACAVASGNFINLLVHHTHKILESNLKIDLKYFEPYLFQSLTNAIAQPNDSLTGPFARRDIQTIRTHLKALQNTSFQEIYRSFLKAYDNELLSAVDKKEVL